MALQAGKGRLLRRIAGAWLAGLIAVAAWPTHIRAQELHYFRIATGSAASTYFPIGAVIAAAISKPPGSRPCDLGGSCGVPGLVAIAQTSDGSVTNVSSVSKGLVDSGLATADIVHWAYTGEGLYFRRKPLGNLRVIANLYPEFLHLVVRKGAGIARVGDLVGKRVSLDKPGSGTRVNAEIVLAGYGVSSNQFDLLEVDPVRATDMVLNGELDAFFLIAGYPVPAVSDLASFGKVDLLPIAGNEATQILKRHKFFARNTIPADVYDGIGTTETLSVGAQWVVSAAADEDLVYQVTKALWNPHNRDMLNSGHYQARQIRIEFALSGVTIPLHPGAERYYREIGIIKTPIGQAPTQ
ncbi:MAG TPA: TAXI family TRAP transporter solute-binding subunit [Candidatus Cybelea sp.]|nr:TAXI family TRAP transporter solute-binding subunit [Candidatus Cybelea sp.]